MVGKKRAAAIAALCMVLLLMLSRPSHQQFSDHSCDCYRECYPRCRGTSPPLCKVECGGGCGDTGDRASDCLIACHTDSVCGLPAKPSPSVATCTRMCHKFWGGRGPANKQL